MGQHFVNFALVTDGQLDVAHPELVIYESLPGGHLKLTGAEFLVLKDQWDAAAKGGETLRARGLLEQAINAYLKGFETDWRDAYPGVNAVTLMEMKIDRSLGALSTLTAGLLDRAVRSVTGGFMMMSS